MGAIGSAIATLASIVVLHPILEWPLALRTMQIPVRKFVGQTLLPGLGPAIVAACAGFASAQFIGDTPTSRVVVGLPICLLAYGVALLLALRKADRADLGEIRRALTRRFA